MRAALIRHAATRASSVQRLLGCGIDEPLSEEGHRQAEALAQGLVERLSGRHRGAGTIVCSPLRRARETAEPIQELLAWELWELPGLAERHFGEWTGRLIADLDTAEAAARFRRDPLSISPPGGETTESLTKRVMTSWGEALRRAGGSSILLVVSHDGPIRVLLRELVSPAAAAAPLYGIAAGAQCWLRSTGAGRWRRFSPAESHS